jgi:hypothetical protein
LSRFLPGHHNAFAGEIAEFVDSWPRDDGHKLRMERQHGAQSRERGLGIGARSVIGVVGHVRLDKGKFEFAVAKRVHVINRAWRHLPRAANAALVQVLVDDSADDLAQRIVNPVRFAGADRREHAKLRILLRRRRRDGKDEGEKGRGPGAWLHDGSSHFITRSKTD